MKAARPFREIGAGPRGSEGRGIPALTFGVRGRDVEPDLGPRLGERCEAGGGGCQSHGVVETTTDLREAEPPGIVGIEDGAGEDEVSCGALAEESSHPVDRPVVDHEPEFGHGDGEARTVRDDAHVAGDGELHAQAHARSLDGGDRRDRHAREMVQNLGEALGEADVLELLEVGSGAEVPVSPGQHDDARALGHG